ncbi:reverse transcriptase domain-containing protein [Tanacetum coccineum]
MWAIDRVVAPTPDSAITILETANEFAIKGNHLTLIKGNQFDGRIKTDPHKHIHEFLRICDMFKYGDNENEAVRPMMFPLSLTREAKIWLDELNKGTIENWDELQTTFISRFFPPALFDQILKEIRAFSQNEHEALTDAWLRMKEMLRNCHGHNISKGIPNYGKFLKELVSNKHKLEQISAAFLSDESFAMIQNKVLPRLEDPGSFLIPCNFNKSFSYNALADLGASINLMPYSLYAKLSLETLKPTRMSILLFSKWKKTLKFLLSYGDLSSILPMHIDVIDEILEEDFDALLDEGSKILYSIEGTPLEEKIFAEFDKFIAMNIKENSKPESEEKEPPFKKITFNTNYKIKTSLEEPPTDLELKPLPDHLEYVFLEEPSFLPVIISSQLSKENKNKLVSVLKNHKQAFCLENHRYLWCMLAIFHDMIEEFIEVFMDDFSLFGNSFDHCLKNLNKMLKRCKDAHLVLNWEKCHFMVEEGIVLGHKESGASLEVEKAKIDVISKLPPPTNVKGIRKFDIEIKDKKGVENVAADHLSRIENYETSDDSEVDDNFPKETLKEITTKDEPWFADFANYLAGDVIPKGMMYQQKKKLFSDLKTAFGKNPTFSKYVQMV